LEGPLSEAAASVEVSTLRYAPNVSTYYRLPFLLASAPLGGPRVEHLDKNARQRLSNCKSRSLLGFDREQQRMSCGTPITCTAVSAWGTPRARSMRTSASRRFA